MFKYIALGILALAILFGMGACTWGVGVYNGLASGNQSVDAAWSQVQNVYQRRLDLIPNLVETVKGVAKFEKDTFTAVAEARASAGKVTVDMKNAPATMEEIKAFQQAQSGLGSALSRLMVVSEQYPQLKANENFTTLQAQLEGTENRIAVERRNFNETVKDYNNRVVRFPGNILAGMFNFKTRPYFEADAAAKTAPKVQF
jgi:LemA protein